MKIKFSIIYFIILFAAFTLAACSNNSDDGESGSAISVPCELVDKSDIQDAFGGQVADGVPGNARNCVYTVTNAAIPAISKVNVYLFSTNANTEWESCRNGYIQNRGGVTMLAGIGDRAFCPKDAGQNEIVAQKGTIIFAVDSFAVPANTNRNLATLKLAKAIADSL